MTGQELQEDEGYTERCKAVAQGADTLEEGPTHTNSRVHCQEQLRD